MSEQKIFEIPAKAGKKAWIDNKSYLRMYQESVNNPKGFWDEQAERIDWFKKWDIITTLGHTIRTWVVVYDDKSHVQLANKDFYSLLTHGHTTVNGEEVTETVEGERGPISTAIAQVQKEAGTSPKTLTTPEEQLELEDFREDAMRDNYSPVFGKKYGPDSLMILGDRKSVV